MKKLYNKFLYGLRWNTLESILYQLIFLTHHLLLFKVIESSFYGLIEVIFSSCYLIITLANFGLDASLSPFFSLFIKSKQNFKRLFLTQFLLQTSLFMFIGIIICCGKSLFPIQSLDTSFFIIISLIIFLEGIKKTLRTLLQLAFLNKKTALVEIAIIALYVALVWLCYLLGYAITLYIIFIPMLIESFVGTGLLLYFVYRFYKDLPDSSEATQQEHILPKNITVRIIKSRFFTYLNQTGQLLFSHNFLVPFFALHFGLAQAGLFKLLGHIFRCITTILHKALGQTSNAFLSHSKQMPLETKQNIFSIVTHKLYHVVYGIIIFFMINYKKIICMHDMPYCTINWAIIYLFFITSFSEYFFITYEKFYIVEEKADILCIFSLLTLLIPYVTLHYCMHSSSLYTLIFMVTTRICAFLILALLSLYKWNIKPRWHINPAYFLSSLTLSLIFFFFVK